MIRSARSVFGLLVALLAGACAEDAPPPSVLRLVRIPNDPDGVFLNETLVFQFSERLDPSSVHSASVRIRDLQGRPARGELEVLERRIQFLPAPVTQPDLSGGGLEPSTRYQVALRGFPELDGLRAESGAPLARTELFQFQTVDPAEPRTGYVFEDATPTSAEPLRFSLESLVLAPDEPIVFEGGEPLDPASLDAGNFVLRKKIDRADSRIDYVLGESIALKAYLVDNRLPDPAKGARRTLLHVRPLDELSPGKYELYVPLAKLALRDFGGNRVTIRDMSVTQTYDLVVPEGGGREASKRYREEFLDPILKSGLFVQGVHGTSAWGASGLCELPFPAAAGTGVDGDVVLAGDVRAIDVNATTLRVPADAEAVIDAGWRTVVLRAQGDLEIGGRLLRRFPPTESPSGRIGDALDFALDPTRDSEGLGPDSSDVPGSEGEAGDSTGPVPIALSDWLAWAEAQERGWTVIVAGGDLVVSGALRIPGGVLFVAGGRVRVSGTVQSWRDRPDLDPYRLDARSALGGPDPLFQEAGGFLVPDPPLVNVLRRPLTYAVLSGPVPQQGRARRFGPALVGGRAGRGSYAVRFLAADVDGIIAGDPRAVEHPEELGDVAGLRFLVELTMPAGPAPGAAPEPWDPPNVDFVELSWYPAEERE